MESMTKPESSELNTRYNLLTDQLQEILFGYFSHTLDHQHSGMRNSQKPNIW